MTGTDKTWGSSRGGETGLFSLPEGEPAQSYKVVKSLFCFADIELCLAMELQKHALFQVYRLLLVNSAGFVWQPGKENYLAVPCSFPFLSL